MRCFAWALMSNHTHFVVETGPVPLSTVFKRVNTGFAQRFNRRSERRGYLFQNRFGSRPITDDADLMVVIAYVLRNPLDAGLARDLRDLERYPWSSYGAVTGQRDPLPFECVRSTLLAFADEPALARDRLRQWIARAPAPAPSLDDLIRAACRSHGLPERDLRTGRRTQAAARARLEVCRRANAELGLRPSTVARALGVTRAAVCQALQRLEPPQVYKEDRPPAKRRCWCGAWRGRGTRAGGRARGRGRGARRSPGACARRRRRGRSAR